jgi:hypothetical protein
VAKPTVRWTPVIADLDLHSAVCVADGDLGRRTAVAQDVGQAFLDDPVGRQVHPVGHAAEWYVVSTQVHDQSHLAQLLHEAGHVGQPGRRGQTRGPFVALAQHAEQTAHLDQGRAGVGLDRA